jgi:hypothetical protein
MVPLDDKDTPEKQLEEILSETGYPVELEVASTLEGLKWAVTNNAYFLDSDENKEREVDILAFCEPPGPRVAESFGFYPSLICECKKSTNYDWVFFTRANRPYFLGGESMHGMLSRGQIFDAPKLASRGDSGDPTPLSLVTPLVPLHYFSFERIASTYCEVNPVKKGTKDAIKDNEIRDAIYKTIKACAYYQERTLDSSAKAASPYFPIEVTFLVMVLDGKLVEALVDGGHVRVQKTDHMLLEKSYRPKYHREEIEYVIDVVTKSYFSSYMKMVERDTSLLWEHLLQYKTDLESYLRKPSNT